MTVRTALVTGANRGIGFETCRQLAALGLRVVLTARDRRAGEAAARKLDVLFEELDVADEKSVQDCASRLAKARVGIDVLVNNAGILDMTSLLRLETRVLEKSMRTNFYGGFFTARAFMPDMNLRRYGRIVNVSSGWASFAAGMGGPPAYVMSKAALGALTVKLAAEARDNVKVNAVDPGWVRTDMGGSSADRPVEEGAETAVWLATLPDDGPNGGFFHDRRPVAW